MSIFFGLGTEESTKYLEGLFIKVGRLAFNHLNDHDAQTPYIDFMTVILGLHNFWGLVARLSMLVCLVEKEWNGTIQ